MTDQKPDAVDTQHRQRRTDRTDHLGRAYKGSQLQMQIAVARRKQELSKAIATQLAFPEGTKLVWKSPLEEEKFKNISMRAFLNRST